MATIAQLIAVQKGVKNTTHRDLTDRYRDLGKAPLLGGLTRTYQPKDDEGEQLPAESTRVQIAAEAVLAEAAALMTRHFDITATVDAANCQARGRITVEGEVIAEDVPVPTLLFLEKQLQDLVTVVRGLPKLDPAEKWEFDQTANCWKAEPARTVRTKKIPRNHVRAEPTAEHAAQVDVYMEDVTVGYWTTTKFSGAMPAKRIAELTARAETLLRAVKYAREEANATPAGKREIGAAIFGYLLPE